MAGIALDSLSEKLERQWQAIMAARKAAQDTCARVSDILAEHRMVPADGSFVIFGSLARDEFTQNSDVDWTLLIDGQADPEHPKVAQKIHRRLETANLLRPAPGGTFGKVAFSHQIIQNIGGEADTNENTTQRVLLLLESRAVGDDAAYRRVISGVLNRYLDDDISFLSSKGAKYKVPRFLLNDVVRYWRTMCVDYAHKHRERQGEGWALRNAKLRMSRKLIFVSGLLTCFSCYLDNPPQARGLFENISFTEPLLAHLTRYISRAPLDILAEHAIRYATVATAGHIFDAYDEFLQMLNDGELRTHLKDLPASQARTDKVFDRVRHISNRFQAGLEAFFFVDNPVLAELTRKYGLF